MLEYRMPRMPLTMSYALSEALTVADASPSSNEAQQQQKQKQQDVERAFNNLQALAQLRLNNERFQLPPADTAPGSQQALNSSGEGFHGPMMLGPAVHSKATPMAIIHKFGSLGSGKEQLNLPHGFCLGRHEEIIVADTNNHRIAVFDKMGGLQFQFGDTGKQNGQLYYPRKVAVSQRNGNFVVCDRGSERSRMQIFTQCGTFMLKIAIRFMDIVSGLAVTAQGHIVAVDSVSPTVFVISEEGLLLHWFDCSDFVREPSDIAIRDNLFYICDMKGHAVAVFQENGQFLHRIGNEKVSCFPMGIELSSAGDILIGDSHGNRFHVTCYGRDGVLKSMFECPQLNVSRCCGLKITGEGYVITLAKNNHQVLMLDTLYVQ
ncbi:B-box type zinc finger protein ncl-1-like [Drosophila obscura]|uniref:B-box type zinc finger protein ncl-1-like n=1 Tax=Drosophila obscura TaxID=7282 RepID=UPI001BB16243|nr:B-box type zinc finger protein ncl-1-like [Drosophila obscura]XP_022222636.2 B-box type zinc finger protein ncl-1-like [Drosophila obscura]